ncbi:MAG: phytoene desaturase family protein [Acidimicrobiales bacterium]
MNLHIVGGGLAGLTAALVAARGGAAVTIHEAASELGGRARTKHTDGGGLNLGPHAVGLGGTGARTLTKLGVQLPGGRLRTERFRLLAGGEDVGIGSYLRRNTRHRLGLLRRVVGRWGDAGAVPGVRSAAEAIDGFGLDEGARIVVEPAVQITTYAGDLTLVDAAAAQHQMWNSARYGVRYLDHGWASMIDQLARLVVAAGGRVRVGSAVDGVEHDASGVGAVRLKTGQRLAADAVVVAVADPVRAARLLDDGPGGLAVAALAEGRTPIRMAHLDLAVSAIVPDSAPGVFSLDEAIYLSVPSMVADLGTSRGQAVIHVGRYLSPGEEHDDHRPALEATLDVAQPGWRDRVVVARYAPSSLVSGDYPSAALGGLPGRIATDGPGVPGLALAGDWVQADGVLLDASVDSGRAAAERLLAARLVLA